MKIVKTDLRDLLIIEPNIYNDVRGNFVKIFNKDIFKERGLEFKFEECFYSVSKKNVIRGLHFQRPPEDHTKLIYVPYGKINDVVVDIRKKSPTYGKVFSIELSKDNKKMLYVPKGFAHGFETLECNTIVVYMTTKGYSQEHDDGILWNSIDHKWSVKNPIISERDKRFITLDKFNSPFE